MSASHSTYTRGFDIEVGTCYEGSSQPRFPGTSDVPTKVKREVDPTSDEAPVEVAVGDDDNVPRAFTLLEPYAMELADLADDDVDAEGHFFDALAARAAKKTKSLQ
jgi:hypothetical protein